MIQRICPCTREHTVNWLQRLPGFTRSASGLEWVLWKKLPWIALAGTALPLAFVADGFEVQHTDKPGSPTLDERGEKN